MKKLLLTLSFAFCSILAFGQNKPAAADAKKDTIYTVQFRPEDLRQIFTALATIQKEIGESDIPTKKGLTMISNLQQIALFINSQVEKQLPKKEAPKQ